jgi:hypothetical protein
MIYQLSPLILKVHENVLEKAHGNQIDKSKLENEPPMLSVVRLPHWLLSTY